MTEKEVVIKLFKLKIPEADALITSICCGFFMKGCYFSDSNGICFIGVGSETNSLRMCFNDVVFDITEEEYIDAKNFFHRIENEKIEEARIKKLKKQILDLRTLSEIASKENINISRRVLTEKHTQNTNFKF